MIESTNIESEPEKLIKDFYIDIDEVTPTLPTDSNLDAPIPATIPRDDSTDQDVVVFTQLPPDILALRIVLPIVNELVLLLGIWSEKYFLSRKAWSALQEILQSITDIQVFAALPAKLDIIKKQSHSQLPDFHLQH